nr:hypothetical protein [Tanacetum cinerariifolium]
MKKVQRLLSMTDGDEENMILTIPMSISTMWRIRGKTRSASLTLLIKSRPYDVLFSKAVESLFGTVPEITSDSESECDIQEPLPLLPKLLGAEPNDTSNDDISLADLTLAPNVFDEIKKVPGKRLTIKVLKKKAQHVTSSVPNLSLSKKANSSTKKLILTLMEEVKGLKEQIKIPSDTPTSVSQSGCF